MFAKKDQVIILGKTFQIKEVEGLVDSGSTDVPNQIILINANLCPEQKASTVLHEILEAISATCDLNLSHQTISTLETTLFSILRDNDFKG